MYILFKMAITCHKIIPRTGVSVYFSHCCPTFFFFFLLQPTKSVQIQQLCEPQRSLCDSYNNKLAALL